MNMSIEELRETITVIEALLEDHPEFPQQDKALLLENLEYYSNLLSDMLPPEEFDI